MFAEHRLPNTPALAMTARLLFTSLFLLSGVTHFTNVPYYVSLMHEAVPFRVFWTYVSGVVELLGALMILFGWRPRLGGWLLVVFLVPVTLVVHGYEMFHADTEALRALQQAHFFKGVALTGAALLITQIGVARRAASDPALRASASPAGGRRSGSRNVSALRE